QSPSVARAFPPTLLRAGLPACGPAGTPFVITRLYPLVELNCLPEPRIIRRANHPLESRACPERSRRGLGVRSQHSKRCPASLTKIVPTVLNHFSGRGGELCSASRTALSG